MIFLYVVVLIFLISFLIFYYYFVHNVSSISLNAIKYSKPTVNILTSVLDNNYYIGHITDYIISRPGKLNIIISGESWMNNYYVDLFIGSRLDSYSKNHIYFPQFYQSIYEFRKSIDPNDYRKQKTKFCAYMYNYDVEHRVNLFNTIMCYKNVDAFGKSKNNIKKQNTRFIITDEITYNDIAVKEYEEYKFVISCENKDVNGYFTEKLLHPLIANCIPIYWGNVNVFDIINKKRVIYAPDFTNEELVERIKFLDTHSDEYEKIVQEPWFTDDKYNIKTYLKNKENEILTIAKTL